MDDKTEKTQTKDNFSFAEEFNSLCASAPQFIPALLDELFGTEFQFGETDFVCGRFQRVANGQIVSRPAGSFIMVHGEDGEERFYIDATRETERLPRLPLGALACFATWTREAEYRAAARLPDCGLIGLGPVGENEGDSVLYLDFPGGARLPYVISRMNVSDYSLEEIEEYSLWLIAPFFLFRYEDELDGIDADEQELGNLRREFESLRRSYLRLREQHRLDDEGLRRFIEATRRVSGKLAGDRKAVRLAIDETMDAEA